MSATLTRPTTSIGQPGQLLVAALLPLVAFMATAHLTIVGSTAAAMTPAQVEDRALPYLVLSGLWVLPVVLAALAVLRVQRMLGQSRPVRLLAVGGIGLLVAYVAAQAAIVAFVDTPTLGDSPLYAAAVLLSVLGWWFIDLAVLLTCLQLGRARIARRSSLVTGLLTALLVVVELAVYLPALLGPAQLRDTVGLPPMLLPVLWAVLGGVLWRTAVAGRR